MKRTNFVCTVGTCTALAVASGMCAAHYRRMRRHGDPLAGRSRKGARIEWLEANVAFDGDECLVPPFLRKPNYWQFQQGGEWISAHRWMCQKAHGPAPSLSHQAAHSCGNGHLGCVSPRHLRWATPMENSADKIAHGTLIRGEDQWQAKLTDEDVQAIRARLGGESHASIAAAFGVSRSTVTLIAAGKTWKHIT